MKKGQLIELTFCILGGAEGEISHARMLASRKGSPSRALSQSMMEILPSNSLGSIPLIKIKKAGQL
jgi:hypothetical protein